MTQKLLGNLAVGRAFIVSAPAGTGKTTLVRRLVDEFPSVCRSVSFTTRPPRQNERSGVDYHFVSKQEFELRIQANDLLEYVELFGNYYGTSQEAVLKQLQEGKHVVLVIDTQGALKLKEFFPGVFIFIRPPSLDELKRRLTGRQSESKEAIDERLKWAEVELEMGKRYDYEVVNDDFETAFQVLRSIFIAEERRLLNC